MREFVYLYKDEGVDSFFLSALYSQLSKKINKNKIKFINAQTLSNDENCLKNAKALFIGGGADRFYVKKLNGRGNKRIKDFVSNGGAYFGICAGAYYACNNIDYSHKELNIKEKRELVFFDCVAKGPIGEKPKKKDDKNTELSIIKTDFNDCLSFYEKGCFFDFDDFEKQKAQTIIKYDFGQEKPAGAMFKKHKKGVVVACGFHPELSAKFLDDNFYKYSLRKKKPKNLISILKRHEKKREMLFSFLLEKAKITKTKQTQIIKNSQREK